MLRKEARSTWLTDTACRGGNVRGCDHSPGYCLAMKKADKDDIIAKAKTVNPDIAIFQTKRDPTSAIAFDRD